MNDKQKLVIMKYILERDKWPSLKIYTFGSNNLVVPSNEFCIDSIPMIERLDFYPDLEPEIRIRDFHFYLNKLAMPTVQSGLATPLTLPNASILETIKNFFRCKRNPLKW